MSNLLGVIRAVIGQVYVVAADGSQRLLKEGDRIYSGEEIVTGDSGAVSVSLPDGKTLDLGRNSHWTEHGLNAVSSAEHDTQDVASLQKAIADGADPTQALEATAAGNEPPVQIEGGGGGHTLVQLDMTGKIVDPTAGFKTQGIGAPTWTHELPEGAQTAGFPPVLPPLVQIDDFAGNDGFINKNEINHATINGTSNQNHVTLTFTDSQKNTLTFDVEVKNGHWTTQPDLSGLVEGEITVTATATDVSGRTAQSTTDAIIDVTDLHDNITIDNVTPDNVINIAESHNAQTSVHGTVSGDAKLGDKITLTVNGHEYTDVVIDLGNGALGYRIDVSTQGLLADPHIHATVTSTDEAGNTTQASSDHHVDIDLDIHNTISIETVANDDIVNAAESRMPTMITGVAGGDAQAGDPVTVTVGGRDFHGVVVSNNGQLSYEVPVPTNLLKEGANDVTVQLVSHDAAGNEAIATEHKTVVLDTQAHNALTIETVASDNTVNTAESRMPTLVSGEVTGDAQAGDKVVVSVNGQNFYADVTVDEHGQLRYEVPVPTNALTEGSNDVQVMVTGVDASGNTAIAVDHKTIVLDTQAHNALTIGTVADDNIVNSAESRMPTFISGEVTGDAQAGDKVVVSVNGQNFYGDVTVDEHGQLRYEVPVPTRALIEGNNDVQVMVTGTDNAGNTAIAVDHKTIVLDTQAHNALTIDTVADDNIVNRAESRMPTMISGAVSGDAQAGDKVVVSVNGHEYRGEVVTDENGNLRYEIPVPTNALTEGSNNVQVMVTGVDASGNTAIAVEHKTIVLDTQVQNGVNLNTVAGDNMVNAGESKHETLVTGLVTGKDAKVGDPVVVHVNGHDYDGKMVADANGRLHYEAKIPTGVLTEGKNDVTVSVTSYDAVGNMAMATDHVNVTLDTHADATINLHQLTAGSVLNHDELATPKQLITGEVGGDARIGDKISLEINGNHFGGKVIDLGNGQLGYQIPVDSSAFGDNQQKLDTNVKITATLTAHDAAGNEVTVSTEHRVHIDNHAEAVATIDSVAGDNTVNAHEGRMPTFISGGVTGDAQVGDPVRVHVNGVDYNGLVVKGSDGKLHYEVPLPNGALQEGQNDVTVTITGHDGSGNTSTAVENKTVTVDTHAHNSVTLHDVTSDNILNYAELGDKNQIITGVVGGDAKTGDEVTLEINGQYYRGRVEDMHDGKGTLGYKIPVPSSEFGDNNTLLHKDVLVNVTLVSHDAANNETIAVSNHTIHVDNHAFNGLTIDTVAHDDIVNHAESQRNVHISGHVSGKDAQAGDPVEVIVQGHTFTGKVYADAQGHLYYDVAVPRDTLVEGDTSAKVTIISHDAAGNVAIATHTHDFSVDLHADATISINGVTDDNTLSHAEMDTPKQLISGEVGGDARIGDKVSIEINGNHFGGKVIDLGAGKLGYQIPVDSSAFGDNNTHIDRDVTFTASVTSHDAANNEITQSTTHTVHIDNFATNGLTISHVADDDTINMSESRMPTFISGVASGDAKAGDLVEVSVNGQTFKGEVVGTPGHFSYNVAVPSEQFHENTNDVHVKLTSHDSLGNEVVTEHQTTVTVDTHAENTVSIDNVTQDNVLNHTELSQSGHQTQTITGVVGGDAKIGDEVTIEINHNYYVGHVENFNGQLGYKIPVPSVEFSDNKGHVEKDVTFTAKVISHDAAGNEAINVVEHTVHVDNFAVNDLTIDTVSSDDWVSKLESRSNTIIRGAVTGDDAKAGDAVTVRVSGVDASGKPAHHDYVGKVHVDSNGDLFYSVPVPPGGLYEGLDTVKVSVTSHDLVGNSITTSHTHDIAVDTHADATLSIDNVTADNTLNYNELDTPKQLITGVVGGDAKVGDVIDVTINNQHFNGNVIELSPGKLGYQIPVDSTAFSNNQGKVDGKVTVTVSVTSHDELHNVVTVSSDHVVNLDNHAEAHITMDTVSGDNTINFAESKEQHTTKVSGTVSGADVHEGDKVFVTVNNHTYKTTVEHQPHLHGALGYSVDVNTQDIVADPNVTAHVVGHDGVLNYQKAEVTTGLTVDLKAEASITIDPVTANQDNMINGEESKHEFTTVSGTVGGDAKEGDLVHLHINGMDLTAQVTKDTSGHLVWTKEVSTHDLMVDPQFSATVTVTDQANNVATAEAERKIVVDTKVEATISIDSVTDDNTLNGEELNHHYTLVSGKVTGEVGVGDPMTLHVNGKDYHGTVETQADGSLGYNILVETSEIHADPDLHASIDVTDKAQNHKVATAESHVNIDPHAEATVTINIVSGDDVLNELDQQAPHTTINGVVTGDVKAGDFVHLTINGITHDVEVKPQAYLDGKLGYSFEANTSDLLANPKIVATVDAKDDAGNTLTAGTTHTVGRDDSATAHITIDNVTDDNVINNDEAHLDHTTVSGTVSGDVHLNDQVDLNVNSQHYYTNVIDLGNGKGLGYHVDVSTSDLLSKANPELHASVTGYDAAGNTKLATADHDVLVDTRADADIHITPGSLELNSSRDFWVIQGTVGGDAKAGDLIEITAGGKTFNTHVFEDNQGQLVFNGDHLTDPVTHQNVYINPHDLDANADVTVKIISTDRYGNTATATDHMQANVPGASGGGSFTDTDLNPGNNHNGGTTTTPSLPYAAITISPVAGDNVINQAESQSQSTVIRGTVIGHFHGGEPIIVHVGNSDYPGTVVERPNLPGEFGYEVSVDTQNLLAHPEITVKLPGYDATDAKLTVDVDTQVNAHIHLNDIAGDNTINIVESQNGTTTVSGTVSGDHIQAGSNVTLLVNGQQLTAQVVEDPNTHELTFTKEVSVNDLRQDPNITVSVTAHDEHGNHKTVSDGTTVQVDTHVEVAVKINDITSDNILNLDETQQATTTVTGHVSGDVEAGDVVKVTAGGVTYNNVTIDDKGNFTVDVLTDRLVADKTITVEATGHDAAGNTITHTETHTLSVDVDSSATVTINTVSGDNILSANDLSSAKTEVSGVVGGDAAIGDVITLTVNHVETHVKVIELPNMNGQLGYIAEVNTSDLQADPTIHVKVVGDDTSGNTFEANHESTLTIDDHADVSMNINDVAGDNVLNAQESNQQKTEISGTVRGDVHQGGNVIVTVNGHDIPATLHAAADGNFTFAVSVDTADLLQDQHITYKVTGVDAVGNTVILTEENTITIDQQANNSITIGTVAGDDKVNIDEYQGRTTTIRGLVDGDAHAGDTVTLKINGQIYSGTVSDHDGKLTYDIDVKNTDLKEGPNTVEVSVTGHDAAGNEATHSATHDFTLDTQIEATISVDPVAGDNIINAKEAQHLTHITGVVDGDARDGDIVTLNVNGHSIHTKVVPVGDHLGYDVRMNSAWLHEGDNNVTVNVRVMDEAGNRLTPAYNQVVTLDTHADAKITINNVTGDNHITVREAHHPVTHITGLVEGDVHKGDHVSATIGDKHYDTVLHEHDGRLSYDIPVDTADLHIGNNTVNVSVAAQDAYGNTSLIKQAVDVTVDAPFRHAKHDVEVADKSHHAANHAAHDHGLSNLFDDGDDSLSFNLHQDAKGYPGRDDTKVFTGKDDSHHDKIDLSDLAHQLHEETDIAQLIKGGSEPHAPKGDAANPAHPVHSAPDMSSDSHGSSHYSLDHLIPKPEHYHS